MQKMIIKSDNAYKTIGEVVKILGLKSKNNHSRATHTIRYWEKEFKQIKPKILNNKRRYYNNEPLKLDEMSNHSIKANILKNKLVKISNIIKNIKRIK